LDRMSKHGEGGWPKKEKGGYKGQKRISKKKKNRGGRTLWENKAKPPTRQNKKKSEKSEFGSPVVTGVQQKNCKKKGVVLLIGTSPCTGHGGGLTGTSGRQIAHGFGVFGGATQAEWGGGKS